MSLQYVSTSVPSADGPEKVRGRAVYTADLRRPGMAVGAFLPSPLAHARILSIDTSAAEMVPGVHCVLTQADLTRGDIHPYYGPILLDQPILAIGKVRFAGEPVAAVAAADEETAQEALELIRVEYEELPAVFDPHAALAPGAPRVHDTLEPSAVFADLKGIKPDPTRNICNLTELSQGDVDAAFASAAQVFEDVYTIPPIQGLPLEPHCCLAEVTTSGKITIWSTTQSPFVMRGILARMFRVPVNGVRVVVSTLGGGFGSKGYIKIEPLTIALARKAGVPVRIELSSRQVFTNTHTRHGCEARVKLGVDRRGRLQAAEMETFWDTGAYADTGPRVSQKSAYTALGPYCVENLKITAISAYTNKVPAGAFRGYGVPQTSWALESHMDTVARELGLDPLEFRLRNLEARGTFYNRPEEIVESARACLLAAADEIGWRAPDGRSNGALATGAERPAADQPATSASLLRGRGLAVCCKATVTPSLSQARVQVHEDGSVTLECGTVEMGQGSVTVFRQMAAEALEIPIERIQLAELDTDHTPFDQASGSSRSTYSMGLAIGTAAADVKEQACRLAAERFEVAPEDVRYRGGEVTVAGNPAASATLAELANYHFGLRGGTLVGQGLSNTAATHREDLIRSPATSAFWGIAAAAVEIEVDQELGQVRVLRSALAADAGKAINPRACTGQLEGAAMQALGHALQEELLWDGGQPLNFSLLDYPVPVIDQLPDLRPIVVEIADPLGPHGAKGIGEASVCIGGPAIGNAIKDALGVRVRQMPLNGERVWRTLREASSAPDGSDSSGKQKSR